MLEEAGLTLVGENRAQELEAKAEAFPGFRWHFIGQLQSRKVKQILPYVELIHSVASDSALQPAREARHARDRDPRRGQRGGGRGQGRDRPGRAPGLPRARSRAGHRADDDAAVRARIRRTIGAHFAALRELAAAHDLTRLSMGTSQDFAVAVEEGATLVRVGARLYGA